MIAFFFVSIAVSSVTVIPVNRDFMIPPLDETFSAEFLEYLKLHNSVPPHIEGPIELHLVFSSETVSNLCLPENQAVAELLSTNKIKIVFEVTRISFESFLGPFSAKLEACLKLTGISHSFLFAENSEEEEKIPDLFHAFFSGGAEVHLRIPFWTDEWERTIYELDKFPDVNLKIVFLETAGFPESAFLQVSLFRQTNPCITWVIENLNTLEINEQTMKEVSPYMDSLSRVTADHPQLSRVCRRLEILSVGLEDSKATSNAFYFADLLNINPTIFPKLKSIRLNTEPHGFNFSNLSGLESIEWLIKPFRRLGQGLIVNWAATKLSKGLLVPKIRYSLQRMSVFIVDPNFNRYVFPSFDYLDHFRVLNSLRIVGQSRNQTKNMVKIPSYLFVSQVELRICLGNKIVHFHGTRLSLILDNVYDGCMENVIRFDEAGLITLSIGFVSKYYNTKRSEEGVRSFIESVLLQIPPTVQHLKLDRISSASLEKLKCHEEMKTIEIVLEELDESEQRKFRERCVKENRIIQFKQVREI
jgi:hypothetical protein